MLRQFGAEFTHVQSKLDSLLNAGQYADAAHLLHQLKGVAGNVGAQALSEAAHTLELELELQKTGLTPVTLPEFRAALAQALASVSRLGAGRTGTVLPPERERLTLLCRCLRDQLDNNDLVPVELLEELQSLLAGTPQAILYQELQQQVEQLNYTQALCLLTQLAAEADIALWETT
ncbi:MAG: Hpt domain-containing protein [Nitrosospira sp.]|nr:Hpt domain-containing protein [Nitrosospira sp.]